MTENYTFVALVTILKLTALQMLSLNPFIHFQEEWFVADLTTVWRWFDNYSTSFVQVLL